MKRHSPGPWRWDPGSGDELPSLLDANGDVVCDFGYDAPHDSTAGTPPRGVDALLIMHAPVMLELLRRAYLDPVDDGRWTADIRALLARIDGGGG